MSANMPNWTTWEALKIAAKKAYPDAKVGPQDIDVAQTHDCFTISEIIEYEDLGFCEKGEGGLFIQEGKSDFGGQSPHQYRWWTSQLRPSFRRDRNSTGHRDHETTSRKGGKTSGGAEIGLTHNLSGFIAAHTVLIYGRQP